MLLGTEKITAVLALVAFAPLANAQVVNGNFSSGNVGFTSGYTYFATGLAQGPSQYAIRTDPLSMNQFWTSFGDHTTGTGNMLLANGSTVANTPIWSETLAVTPGTPYAYSLWGASCFSGNVATLRVTVNGTPLAADWSLPGSAGNWANLSGTWNSGTNTTAVIMIVDTNLGVSGNDFALDDIAFTATPEPTGLLSVGLLPLAWAYRQRRRRMKAERNDASSSAPCRGTP